MKAPIRIKECLPDSVHLNYNRDRRKWLPVKAGNLSTGFNIPVLSMDLADYFSGRAEERTRTTKESDSSEYETAGNILSGIFEIYFLRRPRSEFLPFLWLS